MAHRPENTIEAFTAALGMGAPGLETDVWLTADGEAVLHHDPTIGRRSRRRLEEMRRAELPPRVPSLAQLYDACGTHFHLAVDVLDPRAARVVVSTATAASPSAPGRLWLCGTDVDVVASWRSLHPDVHLVHSDPDWRRHRTDPAVWCRRLSERGIEVLNLRVRHCSPEVVDACHAAGVKLFAWGARREGAMRRLAGRGIDGLMSDHVDRLVRALALD